MNFTHQPSAVIQLQLSLWADECTSSRQPHADSTGPKDRPRKMLTPAADDAEYAKLPSFRRQGKSMRLVLLEQRLEISRVRRRDRRRLDDDKVFIVGLRIFREIIAAGHHRLVV